MGTGRLYKAIHGLAHEAAHAGAVVGKHYLLLKMADQRTVGTTEIDKLLVRDRS